MGAHGITVWVTESRGWLPGLATGMAGLAVLATVLAARSATSATERDHPALRCFAGTWFFAATALFAVLLFRLPSLTAPTLQNPDEAQWVAGAITLRYDPVFWRSVDGTTSGPLNVYVLMWPWLGGQCPTLFTARLTGVLLMFGAIWFAGRTLARDFGEGPARVTVLTGLAWLALASNHDFVQYSSEQAPVFLLSLLAWLLLQAWRKSCGGERRGAAWRWFAAGVTAAAIPLSKLQAVPPAAALVALAVLGLVGVPAARPHAVRGMVALIAGAAAGALAFAAYLTIWGLERQFWFSYVQSNLQYTAAMGLSWAARSGQMLPAAFDNEEFGALWIAALAAAAGLMFVAPRGRRELRIGAGIAGAVLFASWVSAVGPGRGFLHYLHFLVVPSASLIGLGVAALTEKFRPNRPAAVSRHRERIVTGLAALALIAAQAFPRGTLRHPAESFSPTTNWTSPEAAGNTVASLTAPDESVAVWGWMPGIHVVARRPQGVRDGNTHRQIEATLLRDAFRARYLFDLKRHRPVVFVDAVGGHNFGYGEEQRKSHGHETWAELRDLIAAEYTFVTTVEGSRIYLRNDCASRASRLMTGGS